MSIHVTTLSESTYFLATVTGVFVMEEVGSLVKDVIQKCYQQKMRKIIVDFSTLEGEIFAIQRALVGMAIAEASSQVDRDTNEILQIAFVASEDYRTNQAPGVAHMKKSGIDAMITTELDEAISWITA